MKTVLIATTGMSPAVLTETIWALSQENPPVIPDEVKVITTVTGKKQIQEKLLGSGVWKELRSMLLKGKTGLRFDEGGIRVVHHPKSGEPLDKLEEHAEHTAFADVIMHELWAYTSQPDTRVIASLAGGFKTMSALMLSTMQLLANPGDRLTHVLVSGGLDNANSGFFFPKNKEQVKSVQLIDIPLIPLRRWFDTLNRKPASYNELINNSFEAIRKRSGMLKLELSSPKDNTLWVKLNGTRHEIKSKDYCWLSFFVSDKLSGRKVPYTIDKNLLRDMYVHIKSLNLDYAVARQSNEEKAAGYIYKRLNDLRTSLKKLGLDGEQLAVALPRKGAWELKLSPEDLSIED
jgi:CRISPR-associated protein (TIGR02584 family)